MCGWVVGGGEERLVAGFKGRHGRSYIQICASQAADMRASLWTYILGAVVHGPTHTHSHTALHTLGAPPKFYCPL